MVSCARAGGVIEFEALLRGTGTAVDDFAAVKAFKNNMPQQSSA
jgi:hypothetical protein